jgi:hypothetical protein
VATLFGALGTITHRNDNPADYSAEISRVSSMPLHRINLPLRLQDWRFFGTFSCSYIIDGAGLCVQGLVKAHIIFDTSTELNILHRLHSQKTQYYASGPSALVKIYHLPIKHNIYSRRSYPLLWTVCDAIPCADPSFHTRL